MLGRTIIIFILLLASLPKAMLAQEIRFSQFFAAPLILNPALAGISEGPRFTINYRNQWPRIGNGPSGSFVSYALGYDQYFAKASSALGVQLSSDRIGGNLLVSNQVGLTYAYQYKMRKNLGIRMGLSANYTHQHLDWFELRFYDMIDPITGFLDQTGAYAATEEGLAESTNLHILSVNAGGVLFSKRYFIGVTVLNLVNTSPEFYSELDVTNRVGMSIQAGAQIPLGKHARHGLSLTPNVYYLRQIETDQLNLGTVLNLKYVFTGLWWRHDFQNPDAITMLFGVTKGIMRLGYSYDINISGLQPDTGGAHELSLVINLKKGGNSLSPAYDGKVVGCPNLLGY